jgi:hypothetical protein
MDDLDLAAGMFRYAESFRRAADLLRIQDRKMLPFQQPIYFLYYHSIELYLKAFFKAQGLPDSETVNLWTDFRALKAACERRELHFDRFECAVFGLLKNGSKEDEHKNKTTDKVLLSRYLTPGWDNLPTTESLATISHSLAVKAHACLTDLRAPIHSSPVSPLGLDSMAA